jgi:predicted glycosyltransferase
MLHGARILVAPLDWGLGHAARCVPIIHRLLKHHALPIIGADGGPLALLRQEFPQLESVRLPGVEVRYSKSSTQLWSMARQFPAMLRSVQAERAAFDRIRQEVRLDAVISDQRFGVRSTALPSVLITHQAFPFTPFAQRALRKLNLHHMSRFDRCWIMDEPDAPGLAGELSHDEGLPLHARYIGTVSRMSAAAAPTNQYRVVAVISGPEPQRTLLEHRLLGALHALPGEHLLVLGQPQQPRDDQRGNVRVRSHLNGSELATAMKCAELVVSRSGYTTLMDLAAIGRTALVIPTPGQEEQEYLGRLHEGTGRFIVQRQDGIDLLAALRRAHGMKPLTPTSGDLLGSAMEDLAALLLRRKPATLRRA